MFRRPQSSSTSTTTAPSPTRRWTVPAVVAPALAAVVLSSCTTASAASPSATQAAAGHGRHDVVQQHLDSLVRDDHFPAALAAVQTPDGKVRDYTAGVADLETGRKVPVDGQVRIGSNTKTFTAAVVLQLVAEGEVDLGAPVETYLPGLVHGQGIDGRAITVRQVLQHTSGLPDYVVDLFTNPDGSIDMTKAQHTYYEPRQLLAMAMSHPADSAPGAQWAYSNTNYLVAGLIVQAVTGRPVGEEITRRIIEPLHLEHTYWPGTGEQTLRGRHPHGYAFPRGEDGAAVPGAPVDVTEMDPSQAWAAGAIVSTPGDLAEFFSALVGGKVLAPAQLAEMQTTVEAPDSDVRGPERYGLALSTFTLSCGGTAWGHGGDIDGFETRNAVTTDGRSAVVAVTATPGSLDAARHVEEAVDAALCQ